MAGVTDMQQRFAGLSGMVQTVLAEISLSGQVFVFSGWATGGLIKVLWWDGDGLCLFAHGGPGVWHLAAGRG